MLVIAWKTHEKESKNATNQNLRCDVINIEYISSRVTFFLKCFSFAIKSGNWWNFSNQAKILKLI